MQNNFDPIFWANNTEESKSISNTDTGKCSLSEKQQLSTATDVDTAEQVQAVADIIINRGIDITAGYKNWINVGFALKDALGEQGRQLFHELSRQNPDYKASECDKQYTSLMRHNGTGITVASFFQMAKNAGVDISDVMKQLSRKVNPSATSVIPPSGANIEEICKTPILGTFDEILAVGGMAEVAETSETFTDGYTFSDKLEVDFLDDILSEVFRLHSSEPAKCDAMILCVLNVVSGLLGSTNGTPLKRGGIYGYYDGRLVYAPLYNIVYSCAGNDKGNLIFAKQLAAPVKAEMLQQYNDERAEYETKMAEWELQKKKDRGLAPKEPVYRSPFVPGNSSSSAVYRAIADNGGWGMMFETEADTVSGMIASDYGNYSDLMRKAHHHESLSMNRVTDKIHIDIDEPRLSIFLTCTPGQLPSLFPSFENGLGSRFLFYNIPDAGIMFHDVFAKYDTPLEDVYKKFGEDLLPLIHALHLRAGRPVQFLLSKRQQNEFNETYQEILVEQFRMLGRGISAFIFRLALENFRFCMILTVLRRLSEWKKSNSSAIEDMFPEEENGIVCDDRDFQTAMTIIGCLINHTARVYAVMNKDDNNPFSLKGLKPKANEKKLYDALPEGSLHTAEVINIAKGLNIPERTAERILCKLCNVYGVVRPVTRGLYKKVMKNE